jgi:hypothetical protein
MKSSMKRTRDAGSTGAATSEATRNGLVVAAIFGALLCLIVFVSMMIGSVASNGSTGSGGGNGMHPPPALDIDDETVNHMTGLAMFSGLESPALCKEKIRFPRRIIGGPCEGYFDEPHHKDNHSADGDDAEHHHRELPLPVRKRYAFCGMEEWARRLQLIEKAAIRDEAVEVPSSGIQVHRQRGLAVSRITGKFLGNKEFTDWLSYTEKYLEDNPKALKDHGGPGKVFLSRDVDDGIIPAQRVVTDKALREAEYLRRVHSKGVGAGDLVCWTGDLREHYVLGFHVVPSEEFYRYVLTKYDQLEGNIHLLQ